MLDQALQRVRTVREQTTRTVSLVRWSLGGLYARKLAKMAPDAVRIVVTLGSPFTGPRDASHARRAYEWLQRGRAQSHHRYENLRTPPPVPTTSIYTRTDGIVAWQCSVQTPGPMAENIEVTASHVGLGVNPLALYAPSSASATEVHHSRLPCANPRPTSPNDALTRATIGELPWAESTSSCVARVMAT